jgi:hypothetical protein
MRSVKRKRDGGMVKSALQWDNVRKMESDVREWTGSKKHSVQEWLITSTLVRMYYKILFRLLLVEVQCCLGMSKIDLRIYEYIVLFLLCLSE